jgi:hypothetical protein
MHLARAVPTLLTLLSPFVPAIVCANVYTVSDTSDAALRNAIQSANAHTGRDTIHFAIPGAGVHTITPWSALPSITDSILIDGYSQPGSSPNSNGPGLGDNAVILIEINGVNTSAGGGQGGLVFYMGAGHSIVRGLVINRCPGSGIVLSTTNGSNVVAGNFIGTDPSGMVARPNGDAGVYVTTVSTNYTEDGDTVGGAASWARNVLSGNSAGGVFFQGANHAVVQGNFIGVNARGDAALVQYQMGILVQSSWGNLIGGTTPQARNIISGNNTRGILLSNFINDPTVRLNRIEGNYIGTDVSGTAAVGNNSTGISVYGHMNFVGGTAPGAGNVISGNLGTGVDMVGGDSNFVQGNFIGTDPSGTLILGNLWNGVEIGSSADMIGGVSPGAGNTVAFNGAGNGIGGGIIVTAGSGNAILGNSIYRNTHNVGGTGGVGIDLNNDGVTKNAPGGPHTGPNHYQNYPVLGSATSSASGTTIIGTLNSTPAAAFRIEIFSDSAANPSGFGEGRTFLGFKNVTTGKDSSASFTFSSTTVVKTGFVVSATATDTGNNTSEFSRCDTVKSMTDVTLAVPDAVRAYGLFQNYPNPSNPSTMISYQIPSAGIVNLVVFDILGRRVATLVNGMKQPGRYEVALSAANLASGVYFYRLTAGQFAETKKLTLTR